jgi:hypothetical protein
LIVGSNLFLRIHFYVTWKNRVDEEDRGVIHIPRYCSIEDEETGQCGCRKNVYHNPARLKEFGKPVEILDQVCDVPRGCFVDLIGHVTEARALLGGNCDILGYGSDISDTSDPINSSTEHEAEPPVTAESASAVTKAAAAAASSQNSEECHNSDNSENSDSSDKSSSSGNSGSDESDESASEGEGSSSEGEQDTPASKRHASEGATPKRQVARKLIKDLTKTPTSKVSQSVSLYIGLSNFNSPHHTAVGGSPCRPHTASKEPRIFLHYPCADVHSRKAARGEPVRGTGRV